MQARGETLKGFITHLKRQAESNANQSQIEQDKMV